MNIKICTRERILRAGVEVALRSSYTTTIVADVVHQAQVAVGTFHYHFNTVQEFREALIKHAITHNILQIIGQAVAAKHPAIEHLSMGTKLEALSSLS